MRDYMKMFEAEKPNHPEYEEYDEKQFIIDNLSYDALINDFDYEILESFHEGYYQGDSIYILKNDNKIGYLQFGWGSCSGCDLFYSCETINDIIELTNSLKNSIVWYDDITQLKEWVNNYDWESSFIDEELVEKLNNYLKKL